MIFLAFSILFNLELIFARADFFFYTFDSSFVLSFFKSIGFDYYYFFYFDYTKDELKMAMRSKNNIIRARHRNNYLMNPVSKLQMKMAHEIRLKKIYMATKNLKSIEGDSLFHEHSDIYEGWYKPDITLGSKENQERIDEIEAKYKKRQ